MIKGLENVFYEKRIESQELFFFFLKARGEMIEVY